ncbi:monovalent cation/H(+) antiporter subunit G [Candidatus Eisenbacteria bacterium]|uniref:Monovalent cation/H(+) antiporter subunit G n=1 Tax=Eiseniibacteriota bacterium TaxID=2212470 RepID=A0ABV6YJV0_UNCEI
MILHAISIVLISGGAALLLIGSLGVNRLPDFYARTHAATTPDTLGLIFSMLGLALYDGIDLNSAKLLIIVVMVALGNPAATHALGLSALGAKLMPWTRKGGKER